MEQQQTSTTNENNNNFKSQYFSNNLSKHQLKNDESNIKKEYDPKRKS